MCVLAPGGEGGEMWAVCGEREVIEVMSGNW